MTAGLSEFTWRKSSYSGEATNCVEIGWRKSSHSGDNANCVEVGAWDTTVGIRDSKAPGTGAVLVRRESFRAFLRRVER